MKKMFIHVGLHKTGSTFLQKEVFPKLNVNYSTDLFKHKWVDGVNLVSDENLSGCPYLKLDYYDSQLDLVKRMKTLFPDAYIIVVFRNKDDWLKSCYKQFSHKMDRRKSITNYDDWFTQVYLKNLEENNIMDFDEYYNLLCNTFNDVLVLHYEQLKNNPDGFIKNICDFIGVDIPEYTNRKYNVSLDKKRLDFIKKLDYFGNEGITLFFKNIFKRLDRI